MNKKLNSVTVGILGIMSCSLQCVLPLFKSYPAFESHIPHIQLGQWPTSIMHLPIIGNELGLSHLYIKREDLSGGFNAHGRKLFGGNKVRKLEFLLADAIKKGHQTVLTYGGIASNHVAATAVYTKQVGLKSIGLLMSQTICLNLRRNLLLDTHFGCQIFPCPGDNLLSNDELRNFLHDNQLDENPYLIPMGGSNVLGVISMVNAVFELKEQIDQGLLLEPDYIYVPFGSMGTTAGLLLGMKAAGLKAKIIPVRVVSNPKFNAGSLCALIQETNNYLHAIDSSFAVHTWNVDTMYINNEQLGNGYASKTVAGENAALLFDIENIILDQTYTAKAAAALIDDCKKGIIKSNDVVLFWYTYCADEFPDVIDQRDMHTIPTEFQKYW